MAKATYLGTLLAVSDGMTYAWTSPMIPYYTSPKSHLKQMTQHEAEFMETISLLGCAFGLPIVLYAVNNIGRKLSILAASFVAALCWLAIILAPNKEILYIARFLAGVAGDICFVATPMYVAEIAHYRNRGFLSASIYLMMIIGILIMYVTGPYTPYYVPPLIGIALNAIQCIFFPFMPESPYYYIFINKVEEAREALLTLRKKLYSDEELVEIKESVEKQKKETGSVKDLIIDRGNRYVLMIMMFLNLGQHFSGITIMIMNLHTILTEAGSNYIDPSIAAIIFVFIMLIGALLASVIIDTFGRKILLITSSLTTGIILALITLYFYLKSSNHDTSGFSWLPAVGCMLYAASFKLGLGLVPVVLTAEIFPTSIKAIGMTIAEVWYIVGAVASVNMYSWLNNAYGIYAPFSVLTVCSFAMVIFSWLVVPETKGKTLDEIQQIIRGCTI